MSQTFPSFITWGSIFQVQDLPTCLAAAWLVSSNCSTSEIRFQRSKNVTNDVKVIRWTHLQGWNVILYVAPARGIRMRMNIVFCILHWHLATEQHSITHTQIHNYRVIEYTRNPETNQKQKTRMWQKHPQGPAVVLLPRRTSRSASPVPTVLLPSWLFPSQ